MSAAARPVFTGEPAPPLPSRYLHASAVLPPELVAQVQVYAAGRYVWIPSPLPEIRAARDAEMFAAIDSGETVAVVAARFGVSGRRVYQMLTERRRRTGEPMPRPRRNRKCDR